MSAYALEPTVVTAATFTPTYSRHNNSVIILGAATCTVSLPPATGGGTRFTFVVGVTATSIVVGTSGTDTFVGGITSATATTGAGTHEALTGADDDITMNGTTAGGIVGSMIDVIDVAEGLWAVNGRLSGSGSLGSPVS